MPFAKYFVVMTTLSDIKSPSFLNRFSYIHGTFLIGHDWSTLLSSAIIIIIISEIVSWVQSDMYCCATETNAETNGLGLQCTLNVQIN